MSGDAFMVGPGVLGRISVVIPSYNRADMIRDALDSVLSQTYEAVEAVVVDDGSTDSTGDVVATYDDPRVVYHHQPNGGLSSARNAGLRRATGEYVAFLDSDDLWLPWKLEAQMEVFRTSPRVGLVFSDMSSFTAQGGVQEERYLRTYYKAFSRIDVEGALERTGTLRELTPAVPAAFAESPVYEGRIFDLMFAGNIVLPSTAVVRRSVLRVSGPFQPELTGPGAEDYHFYLRVARETVGAFIDAPTTLYRISPTGQLSSAGLKEARGDVTVLTYWLERHEPSLPPTVMRRRLADAHGWLGLEALHAGHRGEATRNLLASLRLDALQPRTIAHFLASLIPGPVLAVLRRLRGAIRR